MKKTVRSWIIVSSSVSKDPKKFKTLCDTLGYSYESTVAPWKDEPVTQTRNINYLPEAQVTQRVIK